MYLADRRIIRGRISTCVYDAVIICLQLLIHDCLHTGDACLRWTPCTAHPSSLCAHLKYRIILYLMALSRMSCGM